MSYHLWFTRGPATRCSSTIKNAFKLGATGTRLTFSYGTPALQSKRARRMKKLAKEVHKPCMVVADLEGEKYRLGLSTGLDYKKLIAGQKLKLVYNEKPADYRKDKLHVRSKDFFKMSNKGNIIVIGDGSAYIKLKTLDKRKLEATAIVAHGGTINPNRGLTIQSSSFQPRALTEKDRSDLDHLLTEPAFDAVAVSFVSTASDVKEVRKIIKASGRKLKLIAKIESRPGIKNITAITREADMVMAARGDLALTYPWVDLPKAVQKIAAASQKQKKQWIVATQVAEGLERFGFPTRPEICDLAHWAKTGAGTLLSSETAFGPRPLRVIQCTKIILDKWYKKP